ERGGKIGWLGEEAAAADMAFQQAAALRLGIGAGNRAYGDAETIGEVAMGGQAIAGLQLSVAQVGGQCLGNGLVAGSRDGGEIGNPYCHGYKLSIDSTLCQQLSSNYRY